MLQVARLAPRLLGESSGLVGDFIRGQKAPDGGFRDRSGKSDLYYTVFGLGALLALQLDFPLAPTEQIKNVYLYPLNRKFRQRLLEAA